MLGLDASGFNFPRPLHIFDNDSSILLDGVGDAIRVSKSQGMLGLTSFTYGVFIGQAQGLYSGQQNGVRNIMGNSFNGGTSISWLNKKFYATVYVKSAGVPGAFLQVSTPEDVFDGQDVSDGSSFSTGTNGFNLVVLNWHQNRLKLYIGGGIGGGMGNDLYLVGSVTSTLSNVYYPGDSSLIADFGIGGTISGSTITNTTACAFNQAFYFNGDIPIDVLKTIYNNGEGIDMLNPSPSVVSGGGEYTSSHIESLLLNLRMEQQSQDQIVDSTGLQSCSLEGDADYIAISPQKIA
jgi:hypothetical protein